MDNIFPKTIRHVAIISPAGPADRARIEAGVALLHRWGLKVTVMPHVFSGAREGYLSASTSERLADLHACWHDTGIDLVICARGGFGSAHLLPEIDWRLLRSRPLPLIGYSDITALHLAMLKMHAGIPVAAPMAAKLHEAFIENQFADYTAGYCRAAMLGLPAQIKSPDGGNPVRIIKPGSVDALQLPLLKRSGFVFPGFAFKRKETPVELAPNDVRYPRSANAMAMAAAQVSRALSLIAWPIAERWKKRAPAM